MMSVSQGGEWIVEADVEGYFDNIGHENLIDSVAERVSDGSTSFYSTGISLGNASSILRLFRL